MVVKVIVRGPRGERSEIVVCDTEEQFKNITVGDLKSRIAEKARVAGQTTPLTFNGRDLDDDDKRLSEYGVRDKSIIVLAGPFPCSLL